MSRAYKARRKACEFLLDCLGGAVGDKYLDFEYDQLDVWTPEEFRKKHRSDCRALPILSRKDVTTLYDGMMVWSGVIYSALEKSGKMNELARGRWKQWVSSLCSLTECYSLLATMAYIADYLVDSVDDRALRNYSRLKRQAKEVAGSSKPVVSCLLGLMKPVIVAWFSSSDITRFSYCRSVFCFMGRISLNIGEIRNKAITKWQDTRSCCPSYDALKANVHVTGINEVIREWFPDTFEFKEFFRNHFCPHHGDGSTFERAKSKPEKHLCTAYPVDKYKFLKYELEYDFKGMLQNPFYTLNGQPYVTWSQDCHRGGIVPKSYKTGRFVSLETVTNQFLYEGLGKAVQLLLLKDYKAGWLDEMHCDLRRHYYVRSEHENRNLAARGSVDGDYVTIDLSSASDTVWRDLSKLVLNGSAIETLFRNLRTDYIKLDYQNIYPELYGRKHIGIMSPDSRRAEKKSISIYEQLSYAPMGSADCFPHETIVFAAIVEYALRRLKSLKGAAWVLNPKYAIFWVYGDDIVCHRVVAGLVIEILQSLGMSPNMSKTFLSPPNDGNGWHCFRESCGGEYLDGTDVTPVRISRKFAGFPRKGSAEYYQRFRIPEYGDSSSQIAQLYSMANELFEYDCARLVIVQYLLHRFRFPVYFDETGESGIRSLAPTNAHLRKRWNEDLQRWESQTFRVKLISKEELYRERYKREHASEFKKQYANVDPNDYVEGSQLLYASLYALWMRDRPAFSSSEDVAIDPFNSELALFPAWVEVTAPRCCEEYVTTACLYAAIAALDAE